MNLFLNTDNRVSSIFFYLRWEYRGMKLLIWYQYYKGTEISSYSLKLVIKCNIYYKFLTKLGNEKKINEKHLLKYINCNYSKTLIKQGLLPLQLNKN